MEDDAADCGALDLAEVVTAGLAVLGEVDGADQIVADRATAAANGILAIEEALGLGFTECVGARPEVGEGIGAGGVAEGVEADGIAEVVAAVESDADAADGRFAGVLGAIVVAIVEDDAAD